ncbi:hypothetical protein ACROYT_G008707 [Oculina patagonica]
MAAVFKHERGKTSGSNRGINNLKDRSMASQMKISLLHLLVVALLLCEVLGQQRSSSRRTYNRRPATRYSSGRIMRKECKDEPKANATCAKLVKELGVKVCHVDVGELRVKLERSCAKTCHYCGEPQQGCRTSQFGCCWDVYTPRGDLYGKTGCPECKDHLHLCRRFKRFCNSRKGSAWATGANCDLIKNFEAHCNSISTEI